MSGKFGRTTPMRDAARVATLHSGGLLQQRFAGDQFLHRVTLWRAGEDVPQQYARTAAGLIAALSAATAGDTITLPSEAIAITAAVTIPASVAVIGLSEVSAVIASGFDGTAITLSAGAMLERVRVDMTSNGATAIGVDATADTCRVAHLRTAARGGAATNIGLLIGHRPRIVADEFWQMHFSTGTGDVISWSADFDFSSAADTATWHAIATFPAGWPGGYFAMPCAGDRYYLFTTGTTGEVWQCTNVAAMRATPATTPTYTRVLSIGAALPGGTTLSKISYATDWGARLILIGQAASGAVVYGEHDGTDWTWTVSSAGYANQVPQGTKDVFTLDAGVAVDTDRFYSPTGMTIADFGVPFGQGGPAAVWRNFLSSNSAIYGGLGGADVDGDLHIVRAYPDKVTLLDATPATDAVSVRGVYGGVGVYVISPDGESFISLDGEVFTAGATWSPAPTASIFGTRLFHTDWADGGYLLWHGDGAGDSSILRISLDDGVTFTDKDGDFWTSVLPGVAAVIACGAQTVFLP